jgi:hypothetical protein
VAAEGLRDRRSHVALPVAGLSTTGEGGHRRREGSLRIGGHAATVLAPPANAEGRIASPR